MPLLGPSFEQDTVGCFDGESPSRVENYHERYGRLLRRSEVALQILITVIRGGGEDGGWLMRLICFLPPSKYIAHEMMVPWRRAGQDVVPKGGDLEGRQRMRSRFGTSVGIHLIHNSYIIVSYVVSRRASAY